MLHCAMCIAPQYADGSVGSIRSALVAGSNVREAARKMG